MRPGRDMLEYRQKLHRNSAFWKGSFFNDPITGLHFPRKPIGEQAAADEISPLHLRGRKLSQPGSVR